jgi:hypothetical protein
MKQIRKGIFETNSSSTHCITVKKQIDNANLCNKVVFKGSDYGWRVDTLNTTEEKASYLYSALLSYYEGREKELSDYKNYIYNTLAKNGIDCSFVPDGIYNWMDCYVDHCECLAGFLEYIRSYEKYLMYYLFGDGVVITGNDNDYSCAKVSSAYKEFRDKNGWIAFYKGN